MTRAEVLAAILPSVVANELASNPKGDRVEQAKRAAATAKTMAEVIEKELSDKK